jgi:hypothetical protein
MTRSSRNPCYAVSVALAVLGASCSPLINVAGAFFPAWILCLFIAIAATALLHLVFARLDIERSLGPLVVVYPGLATAIAFGCWVIFYRS